MKTSTKIVIGGVVVVGIGLGYYLYSKPKTKKTTPIIVDTNGESEYVPPSIQQFKKLKTGLTQHIHK